MRRVLLAVDASTADLTPDDELLAEALERRGVAVRPSPVEPSPPSSSSRCTRASTWPTSVDSGW